MCGIAGIFRRQESNEGDTNRVRAMTDLMVHRGPDDAGFLQLDSRSGSFQISGQDDLEPRRGDVRLGCRRLAIIDLSDSGRQPMANERNDVFAVFNGEIFNFIELRAALAVKGHVFRSHTDSEVVVHAYEEWGVDCVSRFNGMWALAVWDQREHRLFCSRDRFGIKPFYYHLDDRMFVFASEIKAILPAIGAAPRPDYSEIGEFLLNGKLCRSRNTFFEGIKRLEPAHNLLVSARDVRASRYWDYQTRSEVYDEKRPVETFRGLLDDSVNLRLRSDVPVGVALSGGLDSTSVLASAAGHRPHERLKVFTAVFPGEPFDERRYAVLAARELGAELFEVEYRPVNFLEDLERVTWHLDYPAQEGQVILRSRLMASAGQHVKVVLEGQGADEMLAGYVDRYLDPYAIDEMMRLRLGNALAAWNHRYGHGRWRGLGIPIQLARKLIPTRKRSPAQGQPFTQDFLRSAHPGFELPPFRQFGDRLTNLMHYDHSTGVLPMLLKYGDALSMASSVESRLPFLDHRLVEFIFGLPVHYKFHRGLSKPILREAMAGAIPEAIRARRDKVGFETPVLQWIDECMISGVRPLLLSQACIDRGIFDPKLMERLLAQQTERPKRGLAYSIFRWLSVEIWFRLFIDPRRAL